MKNFSLVNAIRNHNSKYMDDSVSSLEFKWNEKRIILCLRLKLRNNDDVEVMTTMCGPGKD